MIPLKDRNPTQTLPIVNLTLILLNVAFFFYEVSLGNDLGIFLARYGMVPAKAVGALQTGKSVFGALFPFLSSIFLHGGWFHLGGNMLYLWIFGDNVEDKLGHVRYFVFYIICGLVASSSQLIIDPSSTVPTVGASGAISGVLGAYLLMFPRARVLTVIPIFFFFQIAELSALLVLGFWFVMQFLSGIVSLGSSEGAMGGVAWWAHIGGFAAGLLLVRPFRKFR